MKAYVLTLVSLMVLVLSPNTGYTYVCEVDTYSDAALIVRENIFSPRDRIYVKVLCMHLPAGEYNTHVNWILPNLGIFRSDNQPFKVDNRSDRMVHFWMQLSKNDTFTSLFNNSDYKDEYYGEWVVETYINDVALPKKIININ